MADDENQGAPENAEEAESEAEADEGQEDEAEGETGEGETAEGEEDEGEAAEAIPVAEVPKGPPIITIDDISSFLALDKIMAKADYLKQLKEADEEACQKAMVIQQLKLLMEELEKKKPMSQEDSDLLDQKQHELFDRLQEFEEITKKVNELAALAELDSKSSFQISPYDDMQGPPLPTSAILSFNHVSTGVQAPVKMEDTLEFVAPKEKLPKLVICGTGDWPPKIVVCEGEGKPTGTKECGTNTDFQEILKLKNEIQKTKSGSQIPVKKLYRKLKDLDKDIVGVEKENAELTRKLLQLLQGDTEDYSEGRLLSKAIEEQFADVPEDEVNASGDSPESPGEGSVAEEGSPFGGSVAKEGSSVVRSTAQAESLVEGSSVVRSTAKPESLVEGSVAKEGSSVVRSTAKGGSAVEGSIAKEGSSVGRSTAKAESLVEGSSVVRSTAKGESAVEGSLATEYDESLYLEDQQAVLPRATLPSVPRCTCGKTEAAFSLEFELTRIEKEVQQMLTQIDCTVNKSDQKQKKPAVVIGSCNIATLYNPS